MKWLKFNYIHGLHVVKLYFVKHDPQCLVLVRQCHFQLFSSFCRPTCLCHSCQYPTPLLMAGLPIQLNRDHSFFLKNQLKSTNSVNHNNIKYDNNFYKSSFRHVSENHGDGLAQKIQNFTKNILTLKINLNLTMNKFSNNNLQGKN